jgi:hypothetical protein
MEAVTSQKTLPGVFEGLVLRLLASTTNFPSEVVTGEPSWQCIGSSLSSLAHLPLLAVLLAGLLEALLVEVGALFAEEPLEGEVAVQPPAIKTATTTSKGSTFAFVVPGSR